MYVLRTILTLSGRDDTHVAGTFVQRKGPLLGLNMVVAAPLIGTGRRRALFCLTITTTLLLLLLPKVNEARRNKGLDRLRAEVDRAEKSSRTRKEELAEERRRLVAELEAKELRGGLSVDASPAEPGKLPVLRQHEGAAARRRMTVEAATVECEGDAACGGFVFFQTGWRQQEEEKVNVTFYRLVGNRLLERPGSARTKGWSTYRVGIENREDLFSHVDSYLSSGCQQELCPAERETSLWNQVYDDAID